MPDMISPGSPCSTLSYNGLYLFTEAVITLLIIAIPPVRKGLIRIREMALGEA